MKKRNALQVSIPEPCQENWEQMTQNAQGRFCQSCQKTVIDFAKMSNTELLHFFQNNQGKFCGRLPKDRPDTPILIPDTSAPLSRWAMTSIVAASLLTVVPMMGQQKTPEKVELSQQIQNDLKPSAESIIIKGSVRDLVDQSPLIGAIIRLKHTTLQTTTDISGQFFFNLPPLYHKTEQRFIIEYPGYKPIIQIVNLQEHPILIDAFLPVLEVNLEDVHVIGYAIPMIKGGIESSIVCVDKKEEEESLWKKLTGWWTKHKVNRHERKAKQTIKERNSKSITPQTKEEIKINTFDSRPITNNLTSFQAQALPNPFGQELNIAFHAVKTQQLNYNIFDIQRKQVSSGQFTIIKGVQTIPIAIPNELAAGTYILTFKNESGEQLGLRVIKAAQ